MMSNFLPIFANFLAYLVLLVFVVVGNIPYFDLENFFNSITLFFCELIRLIKILNNKKRKENILHQKSERLDT